MALSLPASSLLLVTVLIVIYGLRRRKVVGNPNGLPYPPGPRAHPLIGNLRHIPKVSPWLTYARWTKLYGDVISVEAFGQRIVIVNSAKAASDIFDKRGGIYSDRPHNVMIQDLMANNWSVVVLPYTERLRLHRKLLNAALNPTAVVDYIHMQERETYALLDRLLDSPDKFYQHVRRAAGSIILTIGYGHKVVNDNDYYVKLAETTVNLTRHAMQPASFLVNLIPTLKHIPAWMPFAGFQRFARRGRELNRNLREKPFQMVKSQMLDGTAPHSYTSKLLEAKGSITGDSDEERIIQSTAAVLYGAGSDTTVSSIVTFILAMVLYPDVQRKAQAEIDHVVGSSRLPNLADKRSLPYLNCVMLEVMRWQPVTALGVPHAVRQDDVYGGYFIPKGSVILSNIWAMVHDEDVYSDPTRFWPERFDGRFPEIKDPRAFVFGFGRRLCPGRHLAVNSVFIAMAALLSTFNFFKAHDANGNDIEPCIDYSLGPPKPFICHITPRSKEAVLIIRASQYANES